MTRIAIATGPNSADQVSNLLTAISHRGEVEPQIQAAGGATFGCIMTGPASLRSAPGRPFASHDGLTLLIDGAIDNVATLRSRLERCGHSFRTGDQAEVVVHALAEWDSHALDHIDGVFAAAWWNEHTNTLSLSRDRQGVKPMHWVPLRDNIAICSEATPLSSVAGTQISRAAIAEFLHYGTTLNHSAYAGVNELPPGSVLDWNQGAYGLTPFRSPVHAPLSRTSAFFNAVAAQTSAEKRSAVFVSGGVGSALILAALRTASRSALAITLDTGNHDENVDRARKLAAHYNFEHVVERIPQGHAVLKIPEFLDAMDQPSVGGFETFLLGAAALNHGCENAVSALTPFGIRPDSGSRTGLIFGDRDLRNLTPGEPAPIAKLIGTQPQSLTKAVLRDLDAFSMRSGVEVRVPFFDPLLLAHGDSPLDSPSGKRSSARALTGLAIEVAKLSNDRFLSEWATLPALRRRQPWHRWAADTVLHGNALSDPDPWRGFLNAGYARHLLQGPSRGLAGNSLRRWTLLVLSAWLNRSVALE